MKTHLKIRNAALVTALAAVAATATAWAANEYVEAHKDVVVAPSETVVIQTENLSMPPPVEPITPAETLAPNETVVTPQGIAPAPVAAPNPPIVVEDRRLSLDERIQANVIDKLASSPNLSGKIGVESRDAVVTLTGYTSTSGQAYRAGRYAGSVDGVKYVQNEIRARIGGSY